MQTSLRFKNFEGPSLRGTPYFHEFTSNGSTSFSQQRSEAKSPLVTDREKEKETISIYSQRVLFFVLCNEGRLSKKTILPKPNLT